MCARVILAPQEQHARVPYPIRRTVGHGQGKKVWKAGLGAGIDEREMERLIEEIRTLGVESCSCVVPRE